MRNFQGIIFIEIKKYREIFKSALVCPFKGKIIHFLSFKSELDFSHED